MVSEAHPYHTYTHTLTHACAGLELGKVLGSRLQQLDPGGVKGPPHISQLNLCCLLSACLHITPSSPRLKALTLSYAEQVTNGNRILLFLEKGSPVALNMLCRLYSIASLVSHNKNKGRALA